MARLASELIALTMIILAPSLSWAACEVQTGTPTYSNGTVLSMPACDSAGALKTTATLSGGGDASAANQTTLNGYIGNTTDASVSAGATGSISAKLRRLSTDIDALNTLVTALSAKFPAAATPADNTALGSMTSVFSINGCYDGSTVDLCVKGSAGAGNVDTGTARVVLANNSIPCTSFVAVSQADDATVITGTASQYIYICSIVLVGAAAEVVNIIEGTGTVCATGTTVMAGSSTQANGMSFAANGGFSAVSALPFMRTSTLADNLCITQSGTSRVSGWISYTKAP